MRSATSAPRTKARRSARRPTARNTTRSINGHFYWYQQEWSNQTHQCLQRLTFSGAEPTATFTSTAGAGNEMTFDATGSTAPGGVVQYRLAVQRWADGLSTPVETTTPTVSHVFPTNGPYKVALTVFAADGTSIGTARTIRVLPAVVTGAASPLTQTSATLNATVNPSGAEVSDCHFEYGPTEAYGSSATCTSSPGFGTSPVAVSAAISALAANIAYHYRIVATNPTGTSNGSDQTFKTLPNEPAAVTGAGSSVAQRTSTPPAARVVGSASNLSSLHAAVDLSTGVVTLTEAVGDPGTFSWLFTFQNGKFGVFAASTTKCRKGLIRLGGRCRPSRIVFAKGSKAVFAPGQVTFTVRPSASAIKALKNALSRKRGLRVAVRLTFRPWRGGAPVSHASSLTVRLKKR